MLIPKNGNLQTPTFFFFFLQESMHFIGSSYGTTFTKTRLEMIGLLLS